MEEEINKIDADLHNKFLEDRMIFGFTFDELLKLKTFLCAHDMTIDKTIKDIEFYLVR